MQASRGWAARGCIADDVWAKLLWAGLNLEPADLPGNSAGRGCAGDTAGALVSADAPAASSPLVPYRANQLG